MLCAMHAPALAGAHPAGAARVLCTARVGGPGRWRCLPVSAFGTATPPHHAQPRRRRACVGVAAKTGKKASTSSPPAGEAEADAGAAGDGAGAAGVAEPATPPFAELTQRLREAIASGDEDEQEAAVLEVETQLATSVAQADAADAQHDAAKAAVDAVQDKYLRLNAEFENFRKRSTKERSDALGKSKARVIEDLLPVVDAFEAAAGQVKAETDGEQRIAASYQGLYAKMVDAFKKMGLEVVAGVGAPFDPSLHEAIMRAPSPDHPDGTVLQEFRRGFSIDGVLLRPAMVQVSYREDAAAGESAASEAGSEEVPVE